MTVDMTISCAEPTCERMVIRWNVFQNTQVYGGVKNSTASTVTACQDACAANPNCTGLDWDPGRGASDRCWLHGPWSGRRVDGTANGITHYDINRTGICESMLLLKHMFRMIVIVVVVNYHPPMITTRQCSW